ncbi:hypothetical protein MYSEV_014 [Mythimna separata entomopoxvirus 'L']|uniref:Uncharacterized protein n=1 Tax=Mythimna separata entomopoxvirus 'L' TaxID=1293572 RepID=A0A916KQ08_9POXV|nr:hypothetical protein MYSEV_014 [Mythimna separata entomopoxvirus 'L']CCU56212.1 hypothetical protein MYSEV_014 [Mythimna separata entomopoxvirus 'L']
MGNINIKELNSFDDLRYNINNIKELFDKLYIMKYHTIKEEKGKESFNKLKHIWYFKKTDLFIKIMVVYEYHEYILKNIMIIHILKNISKNYKILD